MGTSAAISLVANPNDGNNWQAISWLPVYWPQPAGTAALVVGLGAGRVGLGEGGAAEGGEDGEADTEAAVEADAEIDGRGLRSRSRDTR
jgi:hypothetical protein